MRRGRRFVKDGLQSARAAVPWRWRPGVGREGLRLGDARMHGPDPIDRNDLAQELMGRRGINTVGNPH